MKDNDKKENKVINSQTGSEAARPSRTLHHVNPLGMRILVRIEEPDTVTDGGLYLPETAKETLSESLIAEVIEVASAHDEDLDEAANISGIPQGAQVLIAKTIGIKVPWDDNLRIVDTQDVLAIVEKIDLS